MRFDAPAITGIGAVSPLGVGVAALVEGLRGGRASTRCQDFDPLRWLSLNQARRLDRLSQLILVAARQAADQARLCEVSRERVGIVVGTGFGCLERTEAYLDGIIEAGIDHADPLTFPDCTDNAPAGHCAITLGCQGPSITVTHREISGEMAVILAALLLRRDAADAVIVAAGDVVSASLEAALARLAPGQKAGEASAALILESPDSAARRGARVMGRLLGHGQASDPLPTRPLRPAAAPLAGRASEAALAMAGLPRSGDGGASVLGPEDLGIPIGWCLGDGVLRAVVAIERLGGGGFSAALVGRGARGGSAAALVLGPAGETS